MRLKILLALILTITQFGCAASTPINADAPLKFTYDYKIDGTKKAQLWNRARDYLAEAFVDSKQVIQVADKEDGTLLGRGSVAWNIYADTCRAPFHLRFAAKDGKARLQLEIISGENTGTSRNCALWSLPSKSGYKEIVETFNRVSGNLEKALNGTESSFKDF